MRLVTTTTPKCQPPSPRYPIMVSLTPKRSPITLATGPPKVCFYILSVFFWAGFSGHLSSFPLLCLCASEWLAICAFGVPAFLARTSDSPGFYAADWLADAVQSVDLTPKGEAERSMQLRIYSGVLSAAQPQTARGRAMQREALQWSQAASSVPNQDLSQVTTSIDSLVASLSAYLNRPQIQHTVPSTPPSTASAGPDNDDYVDREIARWEKVILYGTASDQDNAKKQIVELVCKRKREPST